MAISFLFLLTSVVIFILSGKKFFSIDVNILHFNNTLVLSIAVCCFLFLVQLASTIPWLCTLTAFFLHFLWTNVFISSFSIAILVFYNIWVVGIKHKAKKLSPFLIPIGWCVSFLWAVIWLVYGKLTNQYLDSDIEDYKVYKYCEYSCFLSAKSYLIWSFLSPIFIILLANTSVLFLCLYKIRLVLKYRNSTETELLRLTKVSIGGILLIPALCLPFIISLPLSFSQFYQHNETLYTVFEWAYVLSNAPIGVAHFLLITYQIPEARIPKYFRSGLPQQPSSVADSNLTNTLKKIPSLHLNVKCHHSPNIEDSNVEVDDYMETRL